jgi:hypothetical protein
MTQRKEHSWNEWDYENSRKPVWIMMLTSAFVSFVSCLDACLDAVGVRPPLKEQSEQYSASHIITVTSWFLKVWVATSSGACSNVKNCRFRWPVETGSHVYWALFYEVMVSQSLRTSALRLCGYTETGRLWLSCTAQAQVQQEVNCSPLCWRD